MEVRIESMICVWDDAIPTMFLEFVNLLTLATSEEVHKFKEQDRKSTRLNSSHSSRSRMPSSA